MNSFIADGIMPDINYVTLSFIVLGAILSLSIVADVLASRTNVPRISILVLLGVVIAFVQQVVLGDRDAAPLNSLAEPLINLALVMVAFLLGSELTANQLKRSGVLIIVISLCVTLVSVGVVGAGLLLLGVPLVVAVSLAAISVATDPAVVSQSVKEHDRNSLRGKILLGIVAIDDAWGIIVFGLCMAALQWAMGSSGQLSLLHALWELGGAIVLGCVIGLPAAWLTGRLRPGNPTQIEAIAIILLLTGLSSWLGVSSLLASMVAGTLVANLALHHRRSFREIEHIEWPFLVFFFVLSGASIDLYSLDDAIGLTALYIVLRLIGRVLGGTLGVHFIRTKQAELSGNIGLALTPQAGIAIGMALLAAERFPESAKSLLPVAVASTVFFELVGPWLVKRVLKS